MENKSDGFASTHDVNLCRRKKRTDLPLFNNKWLVGDAHATKVLRVAVQNATICAASSLSAY